MAKRTHTLKSVVVVFSPHGNTLSVAETIKSSFYEQGVQSELINLTGKSWDEISNIDYSIVENCDLLVVGSPVYAWRIIEPIERFLSNLPPVSSKYAGLFITYGLISGIALLQAGKLLSRKGYKILGAAKVIASHSMIFEEGKDPFRSHPDKKDLKMANFFAQSLVEKLNNPAPKPIPLSILKPQFLAMRFLAKFVATRYGIAFLPGVHLNEELCLQCGKCEESCPLRIITLEPYPRREGRCIKCYNCLRVCPANASTSLTMPFFDVFHKVASKIYSEKPWSKTFI